MFKLKTVLAYLFVNWWWGFWKRKPKEMTDAEIHQEADECARDTHEKTEVFFGDLETIAVTPSGLIQTEDGLFHEHWKKLRMIIFSCDQEKKVDPIKALRRATGAGLKEAKQVVDDLEEMPAFIGPFKNTPEFVLETLRDAGFLVMLLEVDWEDGEVGLLEAEEDDALVEIWKSLNNDCLWYDPDLGTIKANDSLFCPPLFSYDENKEYWEPEEDEVDPEEEPPEDILFGHEDHELTPNN